MEFKIDLDQASLLMKLAHKNGHRLSLEFALASKRMMVENKLKLDEKDNHFFIMNSMSHFIKDMLFNIDVYAKAKYNTDIFPWKEGLDFLFRATKIVMDESEDELAERFEIAKTLIKNKKDKMQ